ncbi:hypothetical protein [Nostoc sp. WHI]|uniref:hypothetical protein n=1 Tax=Nostoc sp. WHI TaxID=2650611 RepID=UPI0018C5859E|nr:hypothetical protein [Nostoc sp. WHI]MBG1271776.1 hypothetical protein [Nostoc sp. WHI]MBG1272030.1 hypothetical protein [Nostoc sp. WHI]
MKISELSTETLEKIKLVRWDRIIEKHEGPENWESVLRYEQPEFLLVEGCPTLLPVDKSHHPNITIIRCIWSGDKNSVTLFLSDTTYEDDPFFSGFIAVCDRLKNEEFFLAILYHEWFIIERAAVFE